MNIQLKSEELKKLAHSSDTSQMIFLDLSERERYRRTLNLKEFKRNLIRKGAKIVDAEYIKSWRDLQSAGVGEVSFDKRGEPKVFRWYYSLVDIANIGIGKETDFPKEIGFVTNMVKKPVQHKRRTIIRRSKETGEFITITIPAELLKYIKTSS